MRTSVALCTYNGERFLAAQLDSLLAQARRPDEIVVGDDASTDGTWSLLEAFAARAAGTGVAVALHRNPVNLGYVGNFSATLLRATGDIVFLCDQDDAWHADKIARMAAEFDARPGLGLLHTDARLVDAGGADLGHTLFQALEVTAAEVRAEHAGRAFDVLLRRNTVTGATAAIRRTLLARCLPVPDGWIHDEWLAIATSLDAQVDCLAWCSIDYRQHGANQIGARLRTTAEKLAGAGEPKRAYMARVVARLRNFLRRCDGAGLALPPARRAGVEARIAHAAMRASLPASAHARAAAVLREAGTGRYFRYSAGLRSIAGDLLDRT